MEEEEPIFTESNFTTSNNASLIYGNDSTKLTCSTNKKSINESSKGKSNGKKNLNINLLDSLIKLNSPKINIKIKNKKQSNNTIKPFDLNNKKKKNSSRNKNKKKLRVRSYDNKYDKKNKNKNENLLIENKKHIKLLSFDEIYRKREYLPGDFVPFKSKKELIHKHVNVILSDDSIDEPKKINVFPSIKFNGVKSAYNLQYKKLGDDPRFMYIDYYQNHKKIHKSHLFDILKKF